MYATNYMLLLRVSSPQPAQPLPASVHHPLTLTLSGRGGAATNNASPTLCPSFLLYLSTIRRRRRSKFVIQRFNKSRSVSLSSSPVDCCRTTGDALSVLLRSSQGPPPSLLPLSGPLFCVGPSELQLPSSALPSGRPLLSLSFQPLPASTKRSSRAGALGCRPLPLELGH